MKSRDHDALETKLRELVSNANQDRDELLLTLPGGASHR